MSVRVLIADDQALVRAGFRKLLETAPDIEVIGEVADGREAVDQARRLRPSLVLMDIRMPRLDGIEATRRLTADGDGPRVLILTTFGLDEYVFEALRAGASGFMLKDAPPEELLAAVDTIARGDTLLAPAVTRSAIEEFVRRSPAPAPPALEELTNREREVLVLLAQACPTPRSPTGSSSATAPPRPMSRTSCRSSRCAIGSKRSSSPTSSES